MPKKPIKGQTLQKNTSVSTSIQKSICFKNKVLKTDCFKNKVQKAPRTYIAKTMQYCLLYLGGHPFSKINGVHKTTKGKNGVSPKWSYKQKNDDE